MKRVPAQDDLQGWLRYGYVPYGLLERMSSRVRKALNFAID